MSSHTLAADTPEIAYWIALARISILGPVRWQHLLDNFPTMSAAWAASLQELMTAGLDQRLAERIVHDRIKIDPMREYERLQKLGLDVITCRDEAFPSLLRQSPLPPPLLFSRGNVDWSKAVPIAIVGTRKPTPYGQRAAEYLAEELSAAGVTIVSGLAFGIDSIAHTTTVQHKRPTVGVLGCGLDQIYPQANKHLADEIVACDGQIFSTFSPGTPPLRHHFPQRNRVIAGLSLGVVVIEAAQRSGALSTAAAAIEHNREVFVVPGSIFSDQSAGTHALLRAGATPIRTAQDILDTLSGTPRISAPSSQPAPQFSSLDEATIWQLLSTEPIHIDTLIKHSALPSSAVGAALTLLEIQGLIQHLGGQHYIKK